MNYAVSKICMRCGVDDDNGIIGTACVVSDRSEICMCGTETLFYTHEIH